MCRDIASENTYLNYIYIILIYIIGKIATYQQQDRKVMLQVRHLCKELKTQYITLVFIKAISKRRKTNRGTIYSIGVYKKKAN